MEINIIEQMKKIEKEPVVKKQRVKKTKKKETDKTCDLKEPSTTNNTPLTTTNRRRIKLTNKKKQLIILFLSDDTNNETKKDIITTFNLNEDDFRAFLDDQEKRMNKNIERLDDELKNIKLVRDDIESFFKYGYNESDKKEIIDDVPGKLIFGD